MTREERIRALAANIMQRCFYDHEKPEQVARIAKLSIESSARIIDAIDALPVPGEEPRGCGVCGGHGRTWHGACARCNGTGKASE